MALTCTIGENVIVSSTLTCSGNGILSQLTTGLVRVGGALEVPTWRDTGTTEQDRPVVGEQLDGEQQRQLEVGYSDVLQNYPGRTTLMEYDVDTGTVHLVDSFPIDCLYLS